jgi:hypothetical protein
MGDLLGLASPALKRAWYPLLSLTSYGMMNLTYGDKQDENTLKLLQRSGAAD